MAEPNNSHIVIVGAGMVGSALALALGKAGFQVSLIERSQVRLGDMDNKEFQLRVSAITDASRHLLSNLGAWTEIKSHRCFPYREMRVWDANGFSEIHFSADDIGADSLGYIIENITIQQALLKQLESFANIQLISPETVIGLKLDKLAPRITLEGLGELKADLVVAADGANSKLRELANIPSFSRPYNQKGIVANVTAEMGTLNTAWQRFMPTGPLALLPITENVFSIVWTADDDYADTLLQMTEDDFNHAVTQASESKLGNLQLIGKRAAFPLKLSHAEHYFADGLALVGDAAHVIHPLAGQGVNLGFLDAATLVDTLIEAKEKGRPLGSRTTLRQYERARKGDNLITQYSMDGFKKLFGNSIPPVSFMRNLGISVAENITPLKHLFASSGMRSYNELPSLAKHQTQN